MSTLGNYAKGEIYPEAERIKEGNTKLKGKVITIKDVTHMEKDGYYIILAEDSKGNDITFGSATAQTNIIQRFLKEGNVFPQKVKIIEVQSKTGGRAYFSFEDVN